MMLNCRKMSHEHRASCPRSRVWGVLLLLGVVLLLSPARSHAQIQDSFVDTIYVDTVAVPLGGFDFGDTIWVGVGVSNTFAVGGMSYRLVVADTTRITPIYEFDEISGSYPVVSRLVGRGLVFDKPSAVTSVVIRNPDTSNILTGLLVDFEGTASIAQGTGTVIELAFRAKSGIASGDSTRIRVRDDLTRPIEPRNNLSDVTGTLAVYPRLRDGLVLFGVSGPGPGNNAPAITFTPAQSAYSIKQGQTVTFDVTATDPDTTNDLVTLTASLPAGATFAPSNPVSNNVTVIGTFEWTPNFSQEGAFNAIFSASDDKGASSSRTVSITVEKQEIDILFTGSALNAQPRGGIPGKSPVLFPIDVLATRDIFGVQFDLVLSGSAFRVDSIIPTSKLTNFTVWDNIGLNSDTTRVLTFSVGGDSIPLAAGTTIMEMAVTVDTSATPGAYDIEFINVFESISPDPDVASVEMLVENGILFVDAFGDVNLDLSLDVADMVSLTGSILGRYTLNARQFDVADVNADLSTDVIDLVAIINAVLGFDTLTAPVSPVYNGGEAELQLVYAGQAGDQGLFYVDGYMPTDVAGMELTFSFDPAMVEPYVPNRVDEASGLNIQSVREAGRMKVVAYYNANASNAVPAGPGRYIEIPVKLNAAWSEEDALPIALDAAILSNTEAAKVPLKGQGGGGVLPDGFELYQNFPNPFNPRTTIRFDIDAAAGLPAKLDIFNILGQHVHTLTEEVVSAGTYQVTWDGIDRDGRRVATGVYLYRLTVGDEVKTRKMLFLK